MTVNVPALYAKNSVSSTLHTDHPTFPYWQYTIDYEKFPPAQIVPDHIDVGTSPTSPVVWMETYARGGNIQHAEGRDLPG